MGIAEGVNLSQRVYGYVLKLLEKKPHLRDNDNALICNVWHHELKEAGLDSNTLTAFDFMALIARGNTVSSTETIRRTRQKIQEQAEAGQLPAELMGKRREEKLTKQEKVKQQIRDL